MKCILTRRCTWFDNSPRMAIHRKFHTVLRRFAVQKRAVFSGTPCLKLYVDGDISAGRARMGARHGGRGEPGRYKVCMISRMCIR